jgi:hypothetical protein
VERDAQKANALSRAMDNVLGRARVLIPKSDLIRGIRQDILRRIETILSLSKSTNAQLFFDLRRIIASEDSRSFEIAIVSRRVVELIVRSIAAATAGRPLMNAIEDLSQHGVADWIRSYMHTVRIFGNESAHEKCKDKRSPAMITEADVALCLFCVLRILDFWIDRQ